MNTIGESRDQQTKARIVEAAVQLFKQFGYQKTTVADIAEKLGMSPANVYRFFESKKEICETVCLQLTGEVEAACRQLANGPGTATEKIRKLVVVVNHMSIERYTADVRMHEMVAAALRDSWPLVKQHALRLDTIIAEILQQGMNAGEFVKSDPFITARCLHTAMMRFAHPGLMIECADMDVPSLDQMSEFMLRALGQQTN